MLPEQLPWSRVWEFSTLAWKSRAESQPRARIKAEASVPLVWPLGFVPVPHTGMSFHLKKSGMGSDLTPNCGTDWGCSLAGIKEPLGVSCLQLLGVLPREIFPWANQTFRAKILKSPNWLHSSKEFIPHQLNQINRWHVHFEPTMRNSSPELSPGFKGFA